MTTERTLFEMHHRVASSCLVISAEALKFLMRQRPFFSGRSGSGEERVKTVVAQTRFPARNLHQN